MPYLSQNFISMTKSCFILFILCCIFYFNGNSQTYYSLEQSQNSKLSIAGLKFPKPQISNEKLSELMQKNCAFPIASKNNLTSCTIIAEASFDDKGHIITIEILNSSNKELDSISKVILYSTNGYWESAMQNKKPIAYTLHIPIEFSAFYSNQKVYYSIQPFINFPNIFIDSSDSHPALLVLQDYKYQFIVNEDFYIDTELEFYGTSSLGFEIDTFGKISSVNFMNSAGALLDSEAVRFIRNTDGKWIPAFRGGEKRNSYKIINVYYTGAGTNPKLNLQYYLQNKPNQDTLSTLQNYNWKVASNSYYNTRTEGFGFLLHAQKGNTRAKILDHKVHLLLDYQMALEAFYKQDYKSALFQFNKLCNFALRDPEVFYFRALCYFQLKNNSLGCNDLRFARDLALKYGFPQIMDNNQIQKTMENYCGEEYDDD